MKRIITLILVIVVFLSTSAVAQDAAASASAPLDSTVKPEDPSPLILSEFLNRYCQIRVSLGLEGEVLRPSVVFGGGDQMGFGSNETLGEAQDMIHWSLRFRWDNGCIDDANFDFYVQNGFESFRDEAMAFCYALNKDVDPFALSFPEWYQAHAQEDFDVLLSAKMSDRLPWGAFEERIQIMDKMKPYVTFRFDA